MSRISLANEQKETKAAKETKALFRPDQGKPTFPSVKSITYSASSFDFAQGKLGNAPPSVLSV